MANVKEKFLQEVNSSDINDKKTKPLLLIGERIYWSGEMKSPNLS